MLRKVDVAHVVYLRICGYPSLYWEEFIESDKLARRTAAASIGAKYP
jgi:hypothetical protein